MIAVNLLPIELRRLERTPLARQLVIFGSVGINFVGLLVLLAYQWIIVPEAKTNGEAYRTQIHQYRVFEQVDSKYGALIAAKTDFETRKNTINQIDQARVIWAKKLDQLWDLKPEALWFESLELKDPPAPRAGGRNAAPAAPVGSKLTITGFTAGTSIDEVSRFIAALQRPAENEGDGAFFDGFEKLHDPILEKDYITVEGKSRSDGGGKNKVKHVVTRFILTLDMKPHQMDKKPKPVPAPIPAASQS